MEWKHFRKKILKVEIRHRFVYLDDSDQWPGPPDAHIGLRKKMWIHSHVKLKSIYQVILDFFSQANVECNQLTFGPQLPWWLKGLKGPTPVPKCCCGVEISRHCKNLLEKPVFMAFSWQWQLVRSKEILFK